MVDPMNVSGLALSALTLPAQVFSSGVVAYTTISQVKGMGSSFNRHYCHFKVEESRYIYWGMCHRACTPAGFLPNQMPRMIYDTLVQTLVLINDILTDRDKLWSKYGLEQVGMGDEAEPSVIKRESMRQQNEITRLQKASKLVRKIKWAVKDEAKFGLMISEMSSLIRTLYEILPVPGGVRVEDTISAHALSNILLDGAVQQAQQGLQQMPAISMERQMMTAHNTANVRATVESSDGMPPPTSYRAPASRLLLDINQLTIAAQDNIPRSAISVPGLRSLARPRQANAFSGNDLLVEWLRYDLQRDRSFGMNVKAALNIRVEALATMLEAKPRSDSFRVLECVGYIEDNTDSRFGLAFRLPGHCSQSDSLAPHSLFDLIERYPHNLPYLGDRFRLACLLSESLHSLLATGWLHKSINSYNILLSPSSRQPDVQTSRDPVSLDNPYFTGFALSRPDDPNVDSSRSAVAQRAMAMYRHPEVCNIEGRQSAKYRAIHDIYSLGTLLIEIATWRTLSRYYPSHPPPGFNFRKVLLEKVVPGLGVSMGERYMTVVRKCLEGSFERLDHYRPDEYENLDYKDNVRQGLLWEVVTVLRDCRA